MRRNLEPYIAVCGFVALLTPLGLWISWSHEVLTIVLAIGMSAVFLASWLASRP
jgi:hypothetical protein